MPRTRWLPALALTLVTSPITYAQAPLPPEVVDDAADPLNAPRTVFQVSEQQFDLLVFGSQNQPVNRNVVAGNVLVTGRNYQTPRDKLDAILSLKIHEVENICELTSAQREKLRLAGRGDIYHFFEKVEAKRRKFEEVRKDRNQYIAFVTEIQPLRLISQRGTLFADGSLFAKSLTHILDPEQTVRFRETLRQRTSYHYAAAVDLLTSKLGLAMGLSNVQRVRFSRTILDNTRVPQSLGTQEFNAVLYLASTVPIEKFKDILDDAQMHVLERQFDRIRVLEQTLRQQGFIPADEPREKRPNP